MIRENPLPLTQHAIEIEQNRDFWEKKPLLQKIYRGFYAEILARVQRRVPGTVVELGSGIGNFKSVCPEAIATDLFPNPWIDQVESAYHLSFSDGSVSNLVLFDVFHHLAYPGLAFREWARVVPSGGRVLIFDPYISLFGLVVYGALHHEPVALAKKILWLPLEGANPDAQYYAAQGNATRLFGVLSPYREEIRKEWNVVERKRFSALSYILSGGFSKPALYPASFLPLIRGVERILDLFPLLFATRLLVVLEKKS